MSAEQATAIVLRTYDFSESSLVVTLFTREFGKIKGLAKGAKRPKNPFDFALDLLSLCRIVFLRKSGEALHTITEAKLLRRFRVQESGLPGYYAALYAAELANLMTDEEDAQEELFDLLDETLRALQRGLDPKLVVPLYELHMLDLTGHSPSLDSCVSCGDIMRGDGEETEGLAGSEAFEDTGERRGWFFSLIEGGLVCARCRSGKRAVVRVPTAVLDAMQRLRRSPPEAVSALQLSPAVLGPLRGVLSQSISHLLGQRPRMHEYLGLSGR